MSDVKTTRPWYKEGLAFKCTECGKCCQGSPGYIWVSQQEIEAIASELKISLKDFMMQYVRQIGNKYSLRELPREKYSCIFLKDQQCSIYSTRPKQCRTYPYWSEVLKSKDTWDQEAKTCEGISKEHPTVSFEDIQKKLESC